MGGAALMGPLRAIGARCRLGDAARPSGEVGRRARWGETGPKGGPATLQGCRRPLPASAWRPVPAIGGAAGAAQPR
jgi:hypothetical protein